MPDIMMRLGRECSSSTERWARCCSAPACPPGSAPSCSTSPTPEMVGQVLDLYELAGATARSPTPSAARAPSSPSTGSATGSRSSTAPPCASRGSHGAPHVLADMGPDRARAWSRSARRRSTRSSRCSPSRPRALAAENPDAIFIETMTDIAEARCAVLAARSVVRPAGLRERAPSGSAAAMDLSGTDPETAAVILEAAGADCGRDELRPRARADAAARRADGAGHGAAGDRAAQRRPAAARRDGETVFPGHARRDGRVRGAVREAGAAVVGSCCGSSPVVHRRDRRCGRRQADVVEVDGRGSRAR